MYYALKSALQWDTSHFRI